MEKIGGGALGLVVAFLGFCLLVVGVRGTYVPTYEALKSGASSSSSGSSSSTAKKGS